MCKHKANEAEHKSQKLIDLSVTSSANSPGRAGTLACNGNHNGKVTCKKVLPKILMNCFRSDLIAHVFQWACLQTKPACEQNVFQQGGLAWWSLQEIQLPGVRAAS